MAQVRSDIAAIVARLRDQLAAMGVPVARAYLFGSHARGKATESSDIDLIVVSAAFRDKTIRERAEILGVAAARILEPNQALGITPEEAEGAGRSLFVSEVLDHEAIPV